MAHFIFANASFGEWLGEESIFGDSQAVNYTAIAKTEVVALEFQIADLKPVLNADYKRYFTELSLQKHLLLLARIKETISKNLSLYEGD